jgi:hypothetical protein
MGGSFLVFFKPGACDLEKAIRSFSKYGLTVSRRDGFLTVSRSGSPEFDVGVSDASWVREEAAEIAEGTPHEDAMRECSVRFEVNFESLDAALDEINTMMEVQVALQEASSGYLFLPWNGNLSGPGE